MVWWGDMRAIDRTIKTRFRPGSEDSNKLTGFMIANTMFLDSINKVSELFDNDMKRKSDTGLITDALKDIMTLNWVSPTYSESGWLNGLDVSESIKKLFVEPSIFYTSPEDREEYMKTEYSKNWINANKLEKLETDDKFDWYKMPKLYFDYNI